MTSTFACEHGITRPGLTRDPALRNLAERLRDRGYATAAYYSNLLAGPAAGLDRGYEVSRFYDALEPDIADATRFLDAAQGKPFFVYLHTMPPHQPYLTEYPHSKHFGHVSVEQRAAYEDLYHRYTDLKTFDMHQGQPRGTTDNTAEQQRVMAGFAAMRDAILALYDGSAGLAREVREAPWIRREQLAHRRRGEPPGVTRERFSQDS